MMTAGTGPFTEIRMKRAKDVTGQDVVRFTTGTPWREVLDVFHDAEEVLAVFGHPVTSAVPEDFRPYMAKLETDDCTLIRVKVQEASRGGEIADRVHCLYNFDLVDAQSLFPATVSPAWSHDSDGDGDKAEGKGESR